MSFADPFDPTKPADGDLLSLGDDAIRTLARALQQRLLSVFADLNTDPMKLLAAAYADNTIPKSAIATAANLRSVFFGDGSALASSLNPGDTITTTISVPGASTGDVAVVTDQGNDGMRNVITRAWAGPDNATVEITLPVYATDPIAPFLTSFRVAVIKYAS